MKDIAKYAERREIVEMLRLVMESGHRAAQIVDNMLSFSRKGGAKFSACDISELIDKTIDLASNDYDLKRNCDFRSIEIVRENEAGLPEVPCETSKIQQVILNILNNGTQATSESVSSTGSPPTFVIRTAHEAETVRIEIEDNEPGMSEQTRRRAFEPFYTTKDVGAGTGLGLSVSYFIIAENHSGSLEVDSAPGVGATFTIRLSLERSK